VDPSAIEGIDWDLIVKPFHQKGAVVSIREFTNNAMNHHHGMQSVERFGAGLDPDRDDVTDELTVGDVTAVTIFQAALPAPGRARPRDPQRRIFSEPNPFNPPGNLHPDDTSEPFEFDLTKSGPGLNIDRIEHGRARVRAFTDLKRHDLNDAEFDHFANEQLSQGSLVGFASPADFTIPPPPRPTSEFLTRKLWDVGNSDPYGHRGDLTTLTEAIHFHGGDARRERDAFFDLPQVDRDEIIEFLKTLQVLPERGAYAWGKPLH
jgi:hypothetical protein